MCDEYKLIDSTGQCTVIVPYAAKGEEFESLPQKTIRAQITALPGNKWHYARIASTDIYEWKDRQLLEKMHCHQLHVRLGRNRRR